MHGKNSAQFKASCQSSNSELAPKTTNKVRTWNPCCCCLSTTPTLSCPSVDTKNEAIGKGSRHCDNPTSSLVDESGVFGREKDKEEILRLLLNCKASNNSGVCVIGITGKGGVGKTTLAQLVYNDATVSKDSFDSRLWVSFSDEDFNILSTTRKILQEAADKVRNFSDNLNLLQEMMREKLCGKRCLIIFDGIRKVDYEEWDLLRRPFAAANGVIKIIVTTRNVGVPSILGSVSCYHLEVLSDTDCLSVFAHHAIGEANFVAHPNLQEIGGKIARNCKGLPLAAKIFGGKLRSTKNYDEWETISNCEIWELHEKRNGMFPSPSWQNKIIFDGSLWICTICCCN